MKLLLIGWLVLFNVQVHSQTCIVIYVSARGIVAGADRKYHQTITGPGSGQRIFYGKKIFINGKCAWALAGADYNEAIHTMCREAAGKNGSLQTTVSRFRGSMNRPAVKKAMHQLLITSNDEQKTRFKENLTAVVFLSLMVLLTNHTALPLLCRVFLTTMKRYGRKQIQLQQQKIRWVFLCWVIMNLLPAIHTRSSG